MNLRYPLTFPKTSAAEPTPANLRAEAVVAERRARPVADVPRPPTRQQRRRAARKAAPKYRRAFSYTPQEMAAQRRLALKLLAARPRRG